MSSVGCLNVGHLKTNGWTVVNGVLSEDQVRTSRRDFGEWLHGNDGASSLGHSKMMWKLRLHPGVQALFRFIWSCDATESLITSFDGCHVSRGTFFHVDAISSSTRKLPSTSWGAKNVKGAVNLYDSDVDDACLYILKGSHVYYDEFFRVHEHEWAQQSRGECFRLTQAHIRWFELKGCIRTPVHVTAGSVTLWDSRVVYCTHPERRLTAFLCMMPRRLCSASVLKRRKKLALENRTTGNWPNRPRVKPIKTLREKGVSYLMKDAACFKLV